MEDLKNRYIELASATLADNESLASAPLTFGEMFKRTAIDTHRTKLRNYFETLSSLDEEYAQYLNTTGSINDLLMKNAKVQILTQSRLMLVGAVKNYESSLTEFEGQVKFRLNISIAVVAIVVSIVGVVV